MAIVDRGGLQDPTWDCFKAITGALLRFSTGVTAAHVVLQPIGTAAIAPGPAVLQPIEIQHPPLYSIIMYVHNTLRTIYPLAASQLLHIIILLQSILNGSFSLCFTLTSSCDVKMHNIR